MHFADDKTKSIVFASKQRAKNIHKLNKATNIYWMCIRQINWSTCGIKSFEQNKQETKIPL